MVHYRTYQKLPGVRVAAICDVNQRRLTGDWTDTKGNFGRRGEHVDLSGVATFSQLEDMLQHAKLDLVDVTLPPALHATATVAALAAGRHVFCEKPMALALVECDRMLAAARAANRRLFIGHVLPFFPEYAWALDVVRSGRYGRLRGGTFRRVISDPLWNAPFWTAEVGGPLFDLHVHDAHFIRLLFGRPRGVIARGRCRDGLLPEFWTTQFNFENSHCAVAATSGVINQQGRAFAHGFEIHFDEATILFDFAVIDGEGRYLSPPTILTSSGTVETVELSSLDPMEAFEAELRSVVDCAAADRQSELLSGELARDAIELCARQHESLLGSVTA